MKNYEIITVSILPFGLVNAFILKTPDGAILIDTGLPKTEKKILAALEKNQLKISDIKFIIVTHAHVDHAGNASLIRKLSGAKIIAHKSDLKFYERKEIMTFCSTGWFGHFFIKTNLMFEPYEAFTPDILIENSSYDLSPSGFNAKIISTPGHTSGSLSLVLDNDVAFVGDLISSGILLGGIMFTSTPRRPPFEDDPTKVGNELMKLIDSGSQFFYMGHGGPLKKNEVEKHVENLRKIND